MAALTFRITLKQPVLIGKIGAGEENSAISFAYLPGSAIRGMLIRHYVRKHGKIDLAQANATSDRFFDGRISFLNAYPLAADESRTLPTPLSWQVEKDDEDKTAEISDRALPDALDLEMPKRLTAPFCLYRQGEAELYDPARFSGMHNASDTRFVKQKRDSTVFRYDALAAEQSFGGVILCDDEALLKEEIQPLLAPSHSHIGRSRSAGYGQVVIDQIESMTDWSEYQSDDDTGLLVCTFLSDAIVRDNQGQYTTDVRKVAELPNTPQQTFVGADLTGGFNRKWGLPMPQMPVIRAGSVLVFANEPAVKARLQSLVITGIGERRNEGFGRIALNWQGHPQVEQKIPAHPIHGKIDIKLAGEAGTVAQGMVDRLYRTILDNKLTEHLAGKNFVIGGDGVLENTQISRLRIVARRAWHEDNPELFGQFLSDLKSTAKSQFKQARVDNHSLLDWLKAGWENKIWSDYFTIPLSQRPKIGDVTAQDSPQIKREYTARLIDGLCNKTIKGRNPAKEERA